jgi:hypothetical protein
MLRWEHNKCQKFSHLFQYLGQKCVIAHVALVMPFEIYSNSSEKVSSDTHSVPVHLSYVLRFGTVVQLCVGVLICGVPLPAKKPVSLL